MGYNTNDKYTEAVPKKNKKSVVLFSLSCVLTLRKRGSEMQSLRDVKEKQKCGTMNVVLSPPGILPVNC